MTQDMARLRILEHALAAIERTVPYPCAFAVARDSYRQWSPLLDRLLTDIEETRIKLGRAREAAVPSGVFTPRPTSGPDSLNTAKPHRPDVDSTTHTHHQGAR